MKSSKDPINFLNAYEDPSGGTPKDRIVTLLHRFSEAHPLHFIDKRRLCKIAKQLPAIPREGSDVLKDMPKLIAAAKIPLQKKYNKCIVADRVNGWRATHTTDDMFETTLKRRTKRARSAAQSAQDVLDMIDPRKLSGVNAVKFGKTKQLLGSIASSFSSMPQLTEGEKAK